MTKSIEQGLSLNLRLLGTPVLALEGREVELASAKAVALLAYLALNARLVARPDLAALLWDDDRATRDLNQVIFRVRRGLGFDPFVVDGDRLSLRALSDCGQLELAQKSQSPRELSAALELWRGPLLEGLRLRGAELFQDWLSAERERFRTLRLELLARLASLETDPEKAATRWGEYLSLEPLDEAAHRELIGLHLKLGRRELALAQFERCRQVLVSELGVEPLPETVALLEVLRIAPVIPVFEPLPKRLARPGFVGRDLERQQIAVFLERPRGLLLVGGEAGVGKTRLLAEQLRQTPHLAVRAYAALQNAPFHPFVDAVRAQRADNSGAWQGLEPVWRLELERLLPEGRSGVGLGRSDPLAPYEALRQLLLGLGVKALYLDDLHWADPTTLGFLEYLSRRGPPVLATLRLEDEPGMVRRLLVDLERDDLLGRISLERFSRAELNQLLSGVAGALPANLSERIFLESRGNALFALELSKSLFEAGWVAQHHQGWEVRLPPSLPIPATIEGLLSARLERLSPAARQMLEAAAVLSGDLEPTSLERVSGRSGPAAADALDELIQGHILQVQQGRLNFSHDRLAEVVYAGLNPLRSRLLHGRAARALERLGVSPAAVARHYDLGDQGVKARSWYIRAGEAAARALALDAAEQAYSRALELPGSEQMSLAIVQARTRVRMQVGRFQAALEDSQRWEQVALRWGLQSAVLEARIEQTSVLWQMGQVREACLLADQTVEEAAALGEAKLLHQALLNAAYAHDLRGEFALELELLEQAEQIPGESGEQRARRLTLRGVVTSQLGRAQESLEACQSALDFYVKHGYLEEEIRLRTNLGYALNLLGRPEEAASSVRTALNLARQWQIRPRLLMACLNLGVGMRELGQLEEAAALFQEGRGLAVEIGGRDQLPLLLHALGFTLEMLDRLDEAAEVLTEGVAAAKSVGRIRALSENLSRLAQVQRRLGHVQEAKRLALEGLELARQNHNTPWEVRALTQLALAERGAGNLSQALQHIARATQLWADKGGVVWIFGRDTRLAQVQILQEAGQVEEARAALAEALAELGRQAATIHNPKLRSDYLGRIPSHRELSRLEQSLFAAPLAIKGEEIGD